MADGAAETSIRPIGGLLIIFGVGVLFSALVINPWAAPLWQDPKFVLSTDVYASYFLAALLIGLILIPAGIFAKRLFPEAYDNAALLLSVLALLFLFDRSLLAYYGQPLWAYDQETIFRHRPGVILPWGVSFPGKLIRINEHGHHDDEFPIEKAPGEFRALMLGDSVTMGHGVTRDETFSNQLEALIAEQRPSQIINTGVQGFATYQEMVMFERSLIFDPDFVAIGFVMNDITEPFLKDERLGGDSRDYHGVEQFNSAVIGYLWNETGLGRLAQVMWAGSAELEGAQRGEIYNVRFMAANEDDERIRSAWDKTLEDLDEVAALAEEQDIPFLLMVFPFTFQLLDTELQSPQRRLLDHAEARGWSVIDFTEILERLIFDPADVEALRRNGLNPEEIQDKYRSEIERYFLDKDHLTVEGHSVVARTLHAHLRGAQLLED